MEELPLAQLLGVISGEAGWTAEGTHLHHALGTSRLRSHTLSHTLLRGADSNHLIGALGAHLGHPESRSTQGMSKEYAPSVQVYLSSMLHVFY